MKSYSKTPLAIALGATLLPLAAGAGEVNPFALTDLHGGYLLTAEAKTDQGAAKMKDGACGEGKCGASMKKADPAAEKKAMEGKCAAAKPAAPAPSAEKTEGK